MNSPALLPHAPRIEDKVAFLSLPETYAGVTAVEARETHMSWVFITDRLVYKLKKPVRYPFLDHTTLAARYRNCEEELRLNRRLAGGVYRRLVRLCRDDAGRLNLHGEGETVDWLLEMKRLPAEDMLDLRLKEGRVERDEIVAVARKLAHFYAACRPEIGDGMAYLRHLETETRVNRKLLTRSDLLVDGLETEHILDRVEALLVRWTPAIVERIEAGRIVEGHGDLRPEHVCLTKPPRIYDCLEFDRDMRLLDPYDEVGYFGLECAFMGAHWVLPLALDELEAVLGHRPDPRLQATYAAFRATLRARICVAHLLDDVPMEPARWPGEARRYLAVAEAECLKAGG